MIPDSVRARDLIGYGRTPPDFEWPDGAKVVINLVLVYEEGSEYSVLWGDDRNDGWGEYADPGVQPPASRPRHRVSLRVRKPSGRLAAGADLRRRGRAGDRFGSRGGARAEPGRGRVDARARSRPDGPRLALDRGLDDVAREESEQIARAVETYQRVLGSPPAGWNSRGWPSENTRGLLLELGGFVYHSEGYSDDVPYYESRRRRADAGRALLEDLQRLALPDESRLREPA